MNKLKQKAFSYFGDNKVLSYITLICFALMFIFLIKDGVHNIKTNVSFRNFSNKEASVEMVKRTYLNLFQDIIILIFMIYLAGVYLNLPRKETPPNFV